MASPGGERWPSHPVIHEINTWVWIQELGRKDKSAVSVAIADANMGRNEEFKRVLADYGPSP